MLAQTFLALGPALFQGLLLVFVGLLAALACGGVRPSGRFRLCDGSLLRLCLLYMGGLLLDLALQARRGRFVGVHDPVVSLLAFQFLVNEALLLLSGALRT